MRRTRLAASIGLALIAGVVAAQQLYRWTDENGRVHVTDTPPPPTARDVQKKKSAANVVETSQPPFELARAMKDFPVTLYTAPDCQEPCSKARAALNKRSVPFKEVQVWDHESNAELKRVAGVNEVPVLVVGRSVQKGFEPEAFDALLDSASYPKAGMLPARTQGAPAPPEGYVSRSELPKAQPVAPEEPAKPAGPYAPGAPPQRSQKK